MRSRAGVGLLALTVAASSLGAKLRGDVPVPRGPALDFVSLFDGKTLEGWSAVGSDRFVVRDGVIVNDGGTGWLRSNKTYKDFEFQAEYRVVKKGSDSGVFFRATSESTPKAPNWPAKCYQLQILDGAGNFMLFGHGATVMFDRKTDLLATAMKGPGEWQSITLKVVGSRVESSLNGVLVTTSETANLGEGHIGLQGENGHLEWRGLRIKDLSPR